MSIQRRCCFHERRDGVLVGDERSTVSPHLHARTTASPLPRPSHHATSSTVQSFLLASSAFICLASSARSASLFARCSASLRPPRPPRRVRVPPPLHLRLGRRAPGFGVERVHEMTLSVGGELGEFPLALRRLAREEKLPLFRHVLFPSGRVHPAKEPPPPPPPKLPPRRPKERRKGRPSAPLSRRRWLSATRRRRRPREPRKSPPERTRRRSGAHPDPACTPGGLYPAPRSAPEPFPAATFVAGAIFCKGRRARDGRKARRRRRPARTPRRLPQAIHQARGVFGRGGGGHRRRVSGPGRAGRLARGFGQRQTRRHRLLEFAPFAIRLLRLARGVRRGLLHRASKLVVILVVRRAAFDTASVGRLLRLRRFRRRLRRFRRRLRGPARAREQKSGVVVWIRAPPARGRHVPSPPPRPPSRAPPPPSPPPSSPPRTPPPRVASRGRVSQSRPPRTAPRTVSSPVRARPPSEAVGLGRRGVILEFGHGAR